MRKPLPTWWLVSWMSSFCALGPLGCDGGPGEMMGIRGPQLDDVPRSQLTEKQAADARQACLFTAGTLPGLSLARDAPLRGQIPIDTVVVLMLENRSLDHLFATLKTYGQPEVDVAMVGAQNPDTKGMMVPAYHDKDLCIPDTNHDWDGSHYEWNEGKNDGFVIANTNWGGSTDGIRAMSYYTEADLPFMYELANRFAIADRYFCSLLGPTFPNRMYMYGGSSFGVTSTLLLRDKNNNIFEELARAGVEWRTYSETVPGIAIFTDTYARYVGRRTEELPAFFAAASEGTLPPVSFIDPNLRDEDGSGNDFHPPGNVQKAEEFVAQIVNAALHSPQWPHLALFLTFDEHGGLYDHVPPPPACPPDSIEPHLQATDPPGRFDRLGFRVPFIVVSPYAKPHYVSHQTYDHTSILRFIEARFNLPAMTARDANAEPVFDLFDFSQPALLRPPVLPKVVVDPVRYAACVKRFPR